MNRRTLSIYPFLFVGCVLYSCQSINKHRENKIQFPSGDWMMCKEKDVDIHGHGINVNTCPTLTFSDDGQGSLRTTQSIDVPFSWIAKGGYLLLKPSGDNRTRNNLIDNKVYQISTEPCPDCFGVRLLDTAQNISYVVVR